MSTTKNFHSRSVKKGTSMSLREFHTQIKFEHYIKLQEKKTKVTITNAIKERTLEIHKVHYAFNIRANKAIMETWKAPN